jgi:3-methyl-2-oxobutanoate hydroxymethyltransferase
MTERGARFGVGDLAAAKRAGRPIVMATGYDFASASALDAAGVDIVLVGDSAAMTVLGLPATRDVTLDEMLMLTRAVRRGLTGAMLVGDLPFGTYEESDERALATARRFTDIGCDAVKMEGAGATASRAHAVIAAGIPVMGHVGLRPQQLSAGQPGYVEARTADDAMTLLADANALEAAGCFALVFEAVPAAVMTELAPHLHVPTIGIGAGASTDGQVLVTHDLLGLTAGHVPKFVKRYAELRRDIVDAVTRYADDVRTRRFPDATHTYGVRAAEMDALRARLAGEASLWSHGVGEGPAA